MDSSLSWQFVAEASTGSRRCSGFFLHLFSCVAVTYPFSVGGLGGAYECPCVRSGDPLWRSISRF
ncbi:unnamed protein product [Arabidopsis lyrata]|uniref:Uncharacterized protein n=2 Tax=Arabidopsis TaxID=3701 RepID=A0A8T2H4A6_ARASU|nr:hypothetical protein ISN44_As12g039750 [Arabidopsis suecica]KAG7560191.1 hypothetical protein ISN45_Aa05g017390 [Arabidopsis thaliana x Arabidopsis arenosa]CAH8254640.1 unnamed protein product [Arabidopsis lyrata]KAG7586019.1 hypothetical protein ISN45_Aa02g013690 [Arabidopsis thaliana x Arabidopsis arenosa]KAG7593115.1 hypothetical protein ISN45_Aa01g019350 [Arabidopsis thaliana x Arabidopsis arenosa]